MISLRSVRPSDLPLICDHRVRMFQEAGRPAGGIAAMAEPFGTWLQPRLEDGRYFGFIAEDDGQAVGGVGLMEIDWPPHPLHPDEGRRGYVLNVFVEPSYRGRGVAGQLMAAADAEFRRRGLTYAVLHATKAGRPLYSRLGWADTNEMAKELSPLHPTSEA